MKKTALVAFVLVIIFGLTGCGNSATKSPVVNSETEKSNYDVSQFNSPQEIQQESLKIQMDKTMTKQEKAAALEKLQKRNKELLDQVLEH